MLIPQSHRGFLSGTADHVSHLENVSEEEINRLLGMVVDVENLFMSVHKEEDTDTKQVYFYLFKVRLGLCMSHCPTHGGTRAESLVILGERGLLSHCLCSVGVDAEAGAVNHPTAQRLGMLTLFWLDCSPGFEFLRGAVSRGGMGVLQQQHQCHPGCRNWSSPMAAFSHLHHSGSIQFLALC